MRSLLTLTGIELDINILIRISTHYMMKCYSIKKFFELNHSKLIIEFDMKFNQKSLIKLKHIHGFH